MPQNLANFENYDLQRVLEAIKKSKYLQGTNLTFILNHYSDVINSKYEDFYHPKPNQTQNYTSRNYSNFDLNSLYDNLDEIDL